MARRSVRDLLRAGPGTGFSSLDAIDPSASPGTKSKVRALDEMSQLHDDLYGLQERLWAEHTRSVLLVLQGMDTSGKDGTIKNVVSGLNPQGSKIVAFTQPTAAERRHDFLWRIRRRLPDKGQVGIFNRSHYEDVLVVRVHELVPRDVWQARFAQINDFELELGQAGITVVKVCLHISREEQRERLLARLDDPTKRWKFNPGDLAERKLWTNYRRAYDDVIRKCSPPATPWYVVPADRKWYRNWAVTHLMLETLRDLAPRYPEPAFDPAVYRAELERDRDRDPPRRSLRSSTLPA
ncbi:MAG TPA: PPK2 family polyphosphate kinase [Actinomycetota bacterium]|nr:PPK2 family polyphosphate kinase [Actinomycetota bacterium]